MQNIVEKSALLLALAIAAPASLAQGVALASQAQVLDLASLTQVVAPDVLLRTITKEVIGQIKLDADLLAGDPVKVAALVETRVLPLFDFNRMTQSVMARNWRLASPAQQTALVDEFKKLLVRTYSSALTKYRDEVIEFKRSRGGSRENEATVKCDVKRSGTAPMTIDYEMEKTAAGWRIFDVKVAGVRLVSSYREAFAERVRESGVDGLIKSLADMNRQGDSRFNSVKAAFWEKSRLIYAIFQSLLQRP